MKTIISLDQGTTSSRAILFDHQATILAVAQKEFTQIFPQPGWVEHDANEIWQTQSAVIEEVLLSQKLSASDISAIGITNQRETTVVWDRKTGDPITNAIVWQDRRTAAFCEQLKKDKLEPFFRKKTGLLLDPYFSGTKLKWILDNVEGARTKAEKGELAFGTIDSWLVWKLTEGQQHITDISNASRTLPLDIHTGQWDDEILQLLDIPRSILPEVKSCSEIYGYASNPSSLAKVPIAGMAGDQQASLFGQTCFQPGSAKNTYGTGCFVLSNTGNKPILSENNLVSTIAWKIGKDITYALEGSIFMGGATVQWLRDGLGIIKKSSEIEALAQSVDTSDGVTLVPAFSGLGAPHWDPYARGALVGMTRGTTAAHIARAALEAISLQTCDVLDAMQRDTGTILKELQVDGGACANNLLMQIQSDLLNVPIVRPEIIETTARGAAFLAGLATSSWENPQELSALRTVDRIFMPSSNSRLRETLRPKWEKAINSTAGWAAPTETATEST
ncbi:MAG: glycerol kinase GlpK [Opitutaceae bacterium]|nr:glycerol kinase GlpK [Opitutaceae bacterium]